MAFISPTRREFVVSLQKVGSVKLQQQSLRKSVEQDKRSL